MSPERLATNLHEGDTRGSENKYHMHLCLVLPKTTSRINLEQLKECQRMEVLLWEIKSHVAAEWLEGVKYQRGGRGFNPHSLQPGAEH